RTPRRVSQVDYPSRPRSAAITPPAAARLSHQAPAQALKSPAQQILWAPHRQEPIEPVRLQDRMALRDHHTNIKRSRTCLTNAMARPPQMVLCSVPKRRAMERKPPTSGPRTETSRREFFKNSAAAIALPTLAASESATGEPSPQPQQKSKPNLLLIIADQFRWDFVGAYGLNPMGITPNLDSIARRGVAFQNTVTNQPLCCPSRSSLFTGQYPSQTGVWKNGFGLRPGATT